MMDREMPHDLVSIIIPTYRRPEKVRAAAESALGQSWPHIEVIVVSDGPHPETQQALVGLDARLQYLELPSNQGPAAARNAGVAASTGRWLAFLDDDDLMLESKIALQMSKLSTTDLWEMISCRVVYQHGHRQDVWPENPIAKGEDLADYLLLRRSLRSRPGVISLQSLLMHRSIAETVPFSSHSDHEDWAWLLEAWHRYGARVTFVWEPLVIYNIETDNISRSRRMNWEDSVSWAKAHHEWIGHRAFCSFLATKAALKARRAGDWRGLSEIGGLILRNEPGLREMTFFVGVCFLPGPLLHGMWKRSLRRVGTPGTATRKDKYQETFQR